MKQLSRTFCLNACVLISCLGFFGWTQPVVAGGLSFQPATTLTVATELPNVGDVRLCTDSDQKIDLNNANMVAFTDCPGFYPTLAQLIVQNGPYQQVSDVLESPGLSARQKKMLKANLGSFTVTDPVVPLGQRMPPRPAMGKFPGQVR